MRLDALLEAYLVDPSAFPRGYFVDAEDEFVRSIQSDSYLLAIYEAAFRLGRSSYHPLARTQFWPDRTLLKPLYEGWGAGEGVSDRLSYLRQAVVSFFPEGEETLAHFQLVALRRRYEAVMHVWATFRARDSLGERLISQLPHRNATLHQRLLEAPFRVGLSEADWRQVVAEVAYRARRTDAAEEPREEILSIGLYLDALQRAPAALWAQVVKDVESPPEVRRVYATIPDTFDYDEKGDMSLEEDGYDLSIQNYVAMALSQSPFTVKSHADFTEIYAGLSDGMKGTLLRESVDLLLFSYLGSVVRYGFIQGYLERQTSLGSGFLRMIQGAYIPCFVVTLEELLKEGLTDCEVMEGTFVFRCAVNRAWDLFSAVRCRTPLVGLPEPTKTLRDHFNDVLRDNPERSVEAEMAVEAPAVAPLQKGPSL